MPGQDLAFEGLSEALREARIKEAAHFDAVTEIRDAQTLRLYALKQDLLQGLEAGLPKSGFVEITLLGGDPPRLWIDLISSVLMAPDPRTYRFELDTQNGREVLLETRDREEMARTIITHLAHRMIARERASAGLHMPGKPALNGYSGASLTLAWLSGFALGIFALLAVFAIMAGN